MISLEDHQALAQGIDVAHAAGARQEQASKVVGIDVRTLQRWNASEGLVSGDDRPDAQRPAPPFAFSPAERAEVLRMAQRAALCQRVPACIVPRPARVPTTHIATAPHRARCGAGT